MCIRDRRNAKMAMVSKESLSIIKGEEYLTSYKFNTMIAEHFFCRICGIYTHHNRRSDPNGAAVNIGCIDAIKSCQGDGFKYYLQGSAIKYVWRHEHKGKPIEDLDKAIWFLNKLKEEYK